MLTRHERHVAVFAGEWTLGQRVELWVRHHFANLPDSTDRLVRRALVAMDPVDWPFVTVVVFHAVTSDWISRAICQSVAPPSYHDPAPARVAVTSTNMRDPQ